MQVVLAPHSCQHVLWLTLIFFLPSFLSLLLFNFSHFHYCVAVSEIVLLTCIYFHVCLLAIHVSPLMKCLLKTFARIFSCFFVCIIIEF